jgi:hypothetical protein
MNKMTVKLIHLHLTVVKVILIIRSYIVSVARIAEEKTLMLLSSLIEKIHWKWSLFQWIFSTSEDDNISIFSSSILATASM